ncbi:MAG: hexitol phosphatase HxpB [Calditrichia bacterium]
MDGLLIDSEPFWQEAEIEAFRKVNLQLTPENCRETTGFCINEVVDYWYRLRGWSGMSQQEMVEEIVSRVIQLIKEKGKLKPGVEKAIAFVKNLGVKTALASSSNYRIIKTTLEKFNLTSQFDVIHSAEEEDFGKPHPAVYLSTSRKLAVPPDACLAIEDSLPGVIAAKAARMKCIAVPEREDKRFIIADIQLSSLEELNMDIWKQINSA